MHGCSRDPGRPLMPRVSLESVLTPGATALVTQELQGAVVGPDAGLAELAKEAGRAALPNIARLLPAARRSGVQVVHCLVQRRPDGQGSNRNARLFTAAGTKVDLAPGGPGATLLPEFGPEPTDLVLTRWHGVGPMGGTDLDSVLRNLGITTIVVAGVSLNIAIPSLVMDAVNHGYRVVLPQDAVAGVPADYGVAVIKYSLSLLTTVTTTAELLGVWNGK